MSLLILSLKQNQYFLKIDVIAIKKKLQKLVN